MNELKKTGIFWAVTAVMLLIATVIAWPTSDNTDPDSLSDLVGEPLIPKFKDPLAVASMKIVSFDENEGTLSNFEVAKEAESGDWTIVSRKGYPADAVQQVTNAANSLIDLKVLDVVPCTREDHDDLGVIEPKLEDLSVGDEGVGRLVTFRDTDKQVIASIIIGDRVKDSDEQINVRIPGQDPVYIVALDDKPLTTKFQDWIEEDLLKLSSIDVAELVNKDYSANLGGGGQISLQRNFTAEFAKDGSDWKLAKLLEFDPKRPTAQPTEVEIKADQKLNTTKLNETQNALDDLKIVNVLRKPDGMSANLRASEDFLSDQKAVASLAGRGFYPVQLTADGGTEILSANGEMTVGLKDGVEYVLRFGNIAGLSEEESDDEPSDEEDGSEKKKSAAGVNRYLLVTTRVNEAKFPAPDLQEVPQTLEDLKKLDEEEAKKNAPAVEPEQTTEEESVEGESGDAPKEDAAEDSTEKMKDDPADEVEPADAKEDGKKEEAKKEEAASDTAKQDAPAEAEPKEKSTEDAEAKVEKANDKTADDSGEESTGETDSAGSESATATGQALQEVDDKDEDEKPAENDDAKAGGKEDAAEPSEEPKTDKPADATAEEMAKDDGDDKQVKPEPKAEPKADENAEAAAEPKETKEEKEERLEALQEKITKENQRKMDERKDNLAKAKNRVRELNARFADWYYVIPEDTYGKLTIKRSEVFEKADGNNTGSAGPAMPMPGGPGGLPNFAPGN